MISELPYLLSVAALSLSLAGLAGLVAGLRRSDGLRPIDMFRLREMVEFAFANALIALSVVPVATIAGSVEVAVRIVAAGAIVYLVVVTAILFRRLRQADIAMTTWVRIAGVLDIAILVSAAAAVATGSMAAMEVLLLLFLARPMTAFLFVLASFDADLPRSSQEG